MSLPNALATNQTPPAEHATVVELGPVVTDATSESNEETRERLVGQNVWKSRRGALVLAKGNPNGG